MDMTEGQDSSKNAHCYNSAEGRKSDKFTKRDAEMKLLERVLVCRYSKHLSKELGLLERSKRSVRLGIEREMGKVRQDFKRLQYRTTSMESLDKAMAKGGKMIMSYPCTEKEKTTLSGNPPNKRIKCLSLQRSVSSDSDRLQDALNNKIVPSDDFRDEEYSETGNRLLNRRMSKSLSCLQDIAQSLPSYLGAYPNIVTNNDNEENDDRVDDDDCRHGDM